MTRVTGTLHEHQYTFFITSHSIILRMRNVSDKGCRENQNKHFVFTNFFSKNCVAYEIMWKNMVESDRPQMTTLDDAEKMRFAYRLSKARIQTVTHNM